MISKLLKKNEKGFTLMEMLIVVAIIAVLVAIAIPTFNASLNKARVAADEANIRSGYATVMATVLTDDLADEKVTAGTDAYFILNTDGSVAESTVDGVAPATAYACAGKPEGDVSLAGTTVSAWTKGQAIKYTYEYDTGKITIAPIAGHTAP